MCVCVFVYVLCVCVHARVCLFIIQAHVYLSSSDCSVSPYMEHTECVRYPGLSSWSYVCAALFCFVFELWVLNQDFMLYQTSHLHRSRNCVVLRDPGSLYAGFDMRHQRCWFSWNDVFILIESDHSLSTVWICFYAPAPSTGVVLSISMALK